MTALQVLSGGKDKPADDVDVPPHDYECEALIVGVLLWGKAADALAIFREILAPEHFHSEGHRRLYEAELAVADQHGVDAVDLATVIAKLTENGRLAQVGGRQALEELRRNASITNSRRHREWAIAVHDAWRRRRCIEISQRAAALAYQGVEETQRYIEEATRKYLWLANTGHGRAEETTAQRLERIFKATEKRQAARERREVIEGMGASFGLPTLDKLLRGMRPGKKITVVARPGVGKSAFAMQALANAAAGGIGGLYYSAEPGMDADDHAYRLLACLARVDCARLIEGLLLEREVARLVEATAFASKLPLVIVDARGWDMDRVMADAKRRANTFRTVHGGAPLGVIVADHVHAFAPPEKLARAKKFEVVTYNTTRLAELAGELQVCVLELAQEKRGQGGSKGKKVPKPTKDDVSDSSEIEKTTTSMVFLRDVGERDVDGVQKVRIFVVKNRDGENNVDADLEFIAPEVRFLEAYRP